jgi:hypothetical protein
MGSFLAFPILGWFIMPILSALAAIPFYVLWHGCNVKKFFMFLPDVYLNAGFWDMVFLFLTLTMLKSLLLPSFDITNKVKTKD